MPTIICPSCKQSYDVEPDVIGKKVQCAVCNESFIAHLNRVQQRNEFAPQQIKQSTEQQTRFIQAQQASQFAQTPQQFGHPMQHPNIQPVAESDKSRNTFALLGFFLGCLGIHYFYIGKIGNGIASILANFLCSTPVVIFFVGIELLTTTSDKQGLPLQDKDSPVPLVLGILMIVGGILLFIITIPLYLAALGK